MLFLKQETSKYAIFRQRMFERHASLKMIQLPFYLIHEASIVNKQVDLLRFILKAKGALV